MKCENCDHEVILDEIHICEDCEYPFCDWCGPNEFVCFDCDRARFYCCEDCSGPR